MRSKIKKSKIVLKSWVFFFSQVPLVLLVTRSVKSFSEISAGYYQNYCIFLTISKTLNQSLIVAVFGVKNKMFYGRVKGLLRLPNKYKFSFQHGDM